jgi:hypothetical protein
MYIMNHYALTSSIRILLPSEKFKMSRHRRRYIEESEEQNRNMHHVLDSSNYASFDSAERASAGSSASVEEEEEVSSHSNSDNGHHISGKGGGGQHHAPPPSYQLQLHMFNYKPEGFSLYFNQIALKKYIVGFRYTTVNHYDRYIIRVRYHGYEEYSTNKMKINRTDTNQLLLKDFLEAQYVICVTLFSSSGLPEYPPLSTSDMCIDATIGEAHAIGGSHSSTGLLSPLLLAVAIVLLIFITIGYYIKRHYKAKQKIKKAIERRKSLHPTTKEEMEASIKFRNEEVQHKLASALETKELPWQTAAFKWKIVQNDSNANLKAVADEASNRIMRGHDNVGYAYGLEDIDDELEDMYIAARRNTENITSLETLKHVLDNKPWVSRKMNEPRFSIK